MNKIFITILLFLISFEIVNSEELFPNSSLTGNFQFDSQYYKQDSLIGAKKVNEQILSQGYLNLIYNVGKVELGVRYETYQNPLLGIDPQFKGNGFPYQYIRYRNELIDVTAGNFYDQFGSGLIFRTWEEKALGIDNSVYGLRFKVKPTEYLLFTGLVGKQRSFWGFGEGILRGGNLILDFSKLFNIENEIVTLELGALSKYQADLQEVYKLPENVLSLMTKLEITGEGYSTYLELAHKSVDPNASNKYNFNKGYGYNLNVNLYGEGWGFSTLIHKIDNMDFRSERDALLQKLAIGYVPPVTKQHTYRLATLYPYGTILNGEFGIQAEFNLKIPKSYLISGINGGNLTLNYSRVMGIDSTRNIDKGIDTEAFPNGFATYNSPFLGVGDQLFFEDFNLDYSFKPDKNWKITLTHISLKYNKDVLEYEGAVKEGIVNSNVEIIDVTHNISSTNSIRFELQHISSENQFKPKEPNNISGNWGMFLAEYTIAPHYYFTIFDEYNYGNPFDERQLHYFTGSFAYIIESTRIQVQYGRQRGGILCVGGVCRPVPASNGLSLSISSNF